MKSEENSKGTVKDYVRAQDEDNITAGFIHVFLGRMSNEITTTICIRFDRKLYSHLIRCAK